MADAAEHILLADGTKLLHAGSTDSAIQLAWNLNKATANATATGVGSAAPLSIASANANAPAITGVADVAAINVAVANADSLPIGNVTPHVEIAVANADAVDIGTKAPVGVATANANSLAISDFRVVPGQPQNFEAERTNSFQDTELTWDEVSEADKYIITFADHYRERYRKLTEITSSSTTTYTHSHGNPDQRYSYRIYALHADGAKSPNSPAVHLKSQSGEL